MVAGGENLRDGSAVPDSRPRVLGVFQKAVKMAFILKAFRVGKNPGHHAAHRVRYRHGGNLPAGEDEVAKRNLLVHALVNKPLVDALIVTADQNQIVQLA